MPATAIVLGSAQDAGNPQMGSTGRGPQRLIASVGVIGPDGSALLLDVTPDVREQILMLNRYRAHARTSNVVDHVSLTHAHMGHYTGLIHFGKEAHNATGIRTWVTASMAAFLTTNQPWLSLVDGGHLVLEVIAPGEPVEVASGLTLRLLTVPHRDEFSDTVAMSVNDELLYVPDIDTWERWPIAEAEIGRHRVSLLDGCFASSSEVPGRDISAFPHPLVADTVRRFGHLARERRIILTHLNHTNPVSDPESVEAALVAQSGFEVASDGMEISLGG